MEASRRGARSSCIVAGRPRNGPFSVEAEPPPSVLPGDREPRSEKGAGTMPTSRRVHRAPSGRSGGRRGVWAVAVILALLAATGCRSPWLWGRNVVGQLGDGTTFNRLVPFDLDPGWVSVSAGEQHT